MKTSLNNETKLRIDGLDLLRAFSALGVLWIHSWIVHGNPRLVIGPIDLTALLALGGNGVDLFFVISGFCMFYFYGNKPDYQWKDYFSFLKRRWWRISPAFYIATIFYVVYGYLHSGRGFMIEKILTSVFYLNTVTPYNAEGFMWSLGVEFQFYLILPILFFIQLKIGFLRSYLSVYALLTTWAILIILFKFPSDFWLDQLVFRFTEFGFGIIAAYIFIHHPNKFFVKKRILWLIIFIVIAYSGRLFLTKRILDLSVLYYNFFKLIGFNIMALGFSGILLIVLQSKKLQNTSNSIIKFFSNVGRISYSFYLWHGIILQLVSYQVMKILVGPPQILYPIISFVISFIILLPVSFFSFRLLEKPFQKTMNFKLEKKEYIIF